VHIEGLVVHHFQKLTLKTILLAIIRCSSHADDSPVFLFCVFVELDDVLENHIITFIHNESACAAAIYLFYIGYVFDALLDRFVGMI
jgi:hypothetical protein